MKILHGHTSPETAYVVKDYPFGGYRCMQRYWIETRKGFGQRLMTQTTHKAFNRGYTPSEAATPPSESYLWNKPKGGTYSPMLVLYIDPADGYVKHMGIRPSATSAEIEKFGQDYSDQFDDAQRQQFDAELADKKKIEAYWARRYGAAVHAT